MLLPEEIMMIDEYNEVIHGAIIISMHEEGKSPAQISDHLKLTKATVTSIIHRHRQRNQPL